MMKRQMCSVPPSCETDHILMLCLFVCLSRMFVYRRLFVLTHSPPDSDSESDIIFDNADVSRDSFSQVVTLSVHKNVFEKDDLE